MKELRCLRCGEKMRFLERERIPFGKSGIMLADLPTLLAGALEVDIFVCPECKKLEFFANEGESNDNLPTKTCPICGTVHDYDSKLCPRCKHDHF